MRSISIDIGNTLIKAGVFEEEELVEQKVTTSSQDLEEWLQKQNIKIGIVSSVRKGLAISTDFPLYFFGSDKVRLPIKNLYKTPDTLGKDRLAGVIGARALFPESACLAIDMGTCITFDLVTENGEYLGGAISPGLQMRFKAMHHFTSKLPLAEMPRGPVELIGRDTQECLQSGVVNGIKFEIEMAMSTYRTKYPNLKVLLCGGNAQFFESIIKGDIFAFPELVLHGLNHTLLYNNAFH